MWSLGSIRVVQAKRVIMFNVPTENMCEGQRWPSVLCCRWIRCSVYAQTVFKSVSLAQPCGQENESFENRYRRWLYASGFLDIVSDHELLHMTHKEKQRNHSARQTMEAFFKANSPPTVLLSKDHWFDSPGLRDQVSLGKIPRPKLLLMCYSAPCMAATTIRMYVRMNYCKSLWPKASAKCPKM